MFYLTCEFKTQEKFMEALNLLTEYGIPLKDMGFGAQESTAPNGVGKRVVTPHPKHRGYRLKRGAKSTDEGLQPRTTQVKKSAFKILKQQKDGILTRAKLRDLVAADLKIKSNAVSPQLTQLIRARYLEEIPPEV